MQNDRLIKFNSLLQGIIGDFFLENLGELQSDFGLITLNHISLSKDMSYLDIFVSSLKNQETLCKTLATYAQDIKHTINTKITLRKTPIVRFRYTDEMEFTTNLVDKINSLEI